MKISIITPTYNSMKTISRTIDSIISQDYKDIECIVIDGDSSDGTKDIVLGYKNKLDIKLISEKDGGIYDAMNKGVRVATGDIVGILNSDDFFEDSSVISDIIQVLKDEKLDATYGDISYFGDDINRITRVWKTGEYKESNLDNGWIIPHPTLFVRKSVYENCGYFNTNFKIAGDYEFILRILKIYKINIKYIPRVLVRMYNGGRSGSSLNQRINGWKELKKAWGVNNLKISPFFILRRILFKIHQYY